MPAPTPRLSAVRQWLGSAFARLPCAAGLAPMLTGDEHQLATALEAVAVLHNESGLTEPVDARSAPSTAARTAYCMPDASPRL